MSEHEVWNEFGNIYFQIGAYEESAAAFNKAITLEPAAGWYYNSLALVYANKGNYVEAIALYQKSLSLIESDQEKAVVWSRLGNVYELINDYEKSIEAYQHASELDPGNFDIGAVEEEEESVIDDPVEAVEFGSQSGWMPIPEIDPSTPEAEEAIEEATPAGEVIPAEPDIAESLEGWTNASQDPVPDPVSDDENDRITKLVEELIAQDRALVVEGESSTPDIIAEENVPAGEPAAQEVVIQETVIAETNLIAEVETPVAEVPVATEETIVAEEILVAEDESLVVVAEVEAPVVDVVAHEESVETEPAAEPVLIEAAVEETIEAVAQDEVEEIVAEAEEEIEVDDPLSAALASNPILAEAEVPAPTPAKQPSYLNDAVAFMVELTRLAPANDGAWDTLGNLYRASGLYAEAIDAFQQAISLDPNNEEYFYHLGLAFAGQDRHEDAIAAFERTIELKPDHSMAHSALAGHYRKLGKDAESIKHIKQALPKVTDEQEYSRACFEAISGNTDLAIALLQAALEKKQITMEWVRRDPDLDFIRNDPRYISIVGD